MVVEISLSYLIFRWNDTTLPVLKWISQAVQVFLFSGWQTVRCPSHMAVCHPPTKKYYPGPVCLPTTSLLWMTDGQVLVAPGCLSFTCKARDYGVPSSWSLWINQWSQCHVASYCGLYYSVSSVSNQAKYTFTQRSWHWWYRVFADNDSCEGWKSCETIITYLQLPWGEGHIVNQLNFATALISRISRWHMNVMGLNKENPLISLNKGWTRKIS